MANLSTSPDPAPFFLTAADKKLLSITDAEFEPHTWAELKCIIDENRLEETRRRPSDLRRYIAWSTGTKKTYGSSQNYILRERLNWQPVAPIDAVARPTFMTKCPLPLTDPADYRILLTDWPYGLEPGMRHIVVWLKQKLHHDPTTGQMAPATRLLIDDFVKHTFTERVKDMPGDFDKVMWFKYWTSLQSVQGLEHFHVFVRDVPEEIIRDWTGANLSVDRGSEQIVNGYMRRPMNPSLRDVKLRFNGENPGRSQDAPPDPETRKNASRMLITRNAMSITPVLQIYKILLRCLMLNACAINPESAEDKLYTNHLLTIASSSPLATMASPCAVTIASSCRRVETGM